jgi:sulfite exporter TauE/SafE
MSNELLILIAAAASIGFFHTLFGPDHYLPFIVMSKSGKWSIRKTTLVTVVCGVGHVLSSVLLGILGVALGIAVSKLEAVESFRGNIAAWALIAFGLVYFIWGVRRALRSKPHKHLHKHEDGFSHMHTHNHMEKHMHVHGEKSAKSITPWALFTIFVFGPCEPLIPLLMYPAAKSSLPGLLLVVGIFGAITILTMLSIVLISTFGINLIPTARLERYTQAIAGATICLCGISIQFLGL